MSTNVDNSKSIYKKWWFWLILLAIVIIISFTIIMTKAFSVIKSEVGDYAVEVQEIYEDATIYTSAGNNNLVIELRNWNNDYDDKLSQIINITKNKINNGELSLYNKLITVSYIESNNKNEVLFVKMEYNLPEFSQNKEETREYIDFEEYQQLFSTLDETTDSYTELFNNIYY